MKQHDAYAVWRLPAFRRYFTGNMVLILGWQMQKVAIGWEIYERTHSALALGLAGLVQFVPQVLFMLFAGHITDAFNRKRVLMAALIFNARLDAAVCGLLMFLVMAILIDSIRVWVSILSGTREAKLTESPFVLSRLAEEA